MNTSSDFQQRVFIGGYVWHDFSSQYKKTTSLSLLIDPRRTADGVMPIETYKQLLEADPAVSLSDKLFMRFAELYGEGGQVEQHLEDVEIRERLQTRILAFSNTHGLLGIGCGLELAGQPVHAETANTWYSASEKMYRAWKCFDSVMKCRQPKLDDPEGLGGAKLRKAKESLELFYKNESGIIRNAFQKIPELLRYCDLADKESSHQSITANIEAAVLAYAGLITDSELKRFTTMGLAWDAKEVKLEKRYRTEYLIGALWLQFVEYMMSLKGFTFCKNKKCGKELRIMKVEGKRSRSDLIYCQGGKCQKAGRRSGERARLSYNRKPESG